MWAEVETIKYAKHIPRVLQRQLVVHMVDQYIGNLRSDPDVSKISAKATNCCVPSIQRFYGALLFVDISGFTKLSQRLSVEELKKHINDYFTKMVSIISKYGGDIVKFAGDAMYIVWQAQDDFAELIASRKLSGCTDARYVGCGSSSQTPEMLEITRKLMNLAVNCGLEIGLTCSNQIVHLRPTGIDISASKDHQNMRTRQARSIMSLSNVISPRKVYTVSDTESGEDHSDLSAVPMSPVRPKPGVEEELAYLNVHSGCSSGLMAGVDIGLNDRWEYLLIGDPLNKVAVAESEAKTGELIICPDSHYALHGSNENLALCGCRQTEKGYFCVAAAAPLSDNENRLSTTTVVCDMSNTSNTTEDLNVALQQIQIKATQELLLLLKREGYMEQNSKFCSDVVLKFKSNEDLAQSFTAWGHSYMLDNIIRHVHDAARNDFSSKLALMTPLSPKNSRNKRKTGNNLESADAHDAADYSAELRTVFVLFIKIDLQQVDLLVDEGHTGRSGKDISLNNSAFSFLGRSRNELAADRLILQKFQSCIAAVIRALCKHGGHLRQFIVDDKGTVAIGSFGLRGAVNSDNAAMAIEAAKDIVLGLKAIGIVSRIGVTGGKAYCGLVGSPARHEYAIMGPSTNLSARLMCKAPPCGIICENEIQKHDRTHKFQALSSISAKGYSELVQTYRPVFDDGSLGSDSGASNSSETGPVSSLKPVSTYSSDMNDDGSNGLNLELQDMRGSFELAFEQFPLSIEVDNEDKTPLTVGSVLKVQNAKPKQRRRGVVQARHPAMAIFRKIVESEFCFMTKNIPLSTSSPSPAPAQRPYNDDDGGGPNAPVSALGITATSGLAHVESAPSGSRGSVLLHGRFPEIVAVFEFLLCEMVLDEEKEKLVAAAKFSPTRASISSPQPSSAPAQVKKKPNPKQTVVAKKPQPAVKTAVAASSEKKNFFRSVLRAGRALFCGQKAAVALTVPKPVAPIVTWQNVWTTGSSTAAESGADLKVSGSSKGSKVLITREGSSRVDLESTLGVLSGSTLGEQNSPESSFHANSRGVKRGNTQQMRQSSCRSLKRGKTQLMRQASCRSVKRGNTQLMRQSSVNKHVTTREGSVIFDVTKHARMLVVTGPIGTGKGSLLSAINQKLFCVAKQDPTMNISLLRYTHNRFHLNVQFHVWKSLIIEVLIKTARLSRRRRSMHVVSEEDLHFALRVVFSMLPSEMAALKPLLGRLSVISEMEDTPETELLDEEEALERTAELLTAIVGLFPKITGNLVFITMEGIDSFDSCSLALLHKVCKECTGIVILASYGHDSNSNPIVNATAANVGDLSASNSHDGGRIRASSTCADLESDRAHLEELLYQNQAPDVFSIFATEDIVKDNMKGGMSRMTFSASTKNARQPVATYLKQLELSQLSREATQSLVEDLLKTVGKPISPSFVDQIYSAAHGNALYSYELTRMAAESSEGLDSVGMNAVMETELHSHRIEEVICHRFDQLDSDSQMLLKVASVICANGAPFSMAMIEFMFEEASNTAFFEPPAATGVDTDLNFQTIIDDEEAVLSFQSAEVNDDQHKSAVHACTHALMNILKRDEFIQIVAEEDETDKVDALNPGSIIPTAATDDGGARKIIGNKLFEFRISLEQNTIYHLLLDDQKQEIHELIAAFFDSEEQLEYLKAECHYPLTSEMVLVEEAFHWSLSLQWGCALVCYFEAATLVSNAQHKHNHQPQPKTAKSKGNDETEAESGNVQQLGDSSNSSHFTHLLSAYMMFVSMKRDASSADTIAVGNEMLTSEAVANIFAADPSQKANGTGAFTGVWDAASVEAVFRGDATIIRSAVQTMILLSRHGLNNFDNPAVVVLALEEALQLLSYSSLTDESSSYIRSNSRHSDSDCGSDRGRNVEVMMAHHKIKSLSHMYCVVLSGLIDAHMYCNTLTEDEIEKTTLLAARFQLVSGRESNVIHSLQASAKQSLFFCNIGKVEEALNLLEFLYSRYNSEEHSYPLHQMYGADGVPQALAVGAQYLMARGALSRASCRLNAVLMASQLNTHMHGSLEHVLPTCVALVYMKRGKEALAIFEKHLQHRKKLHHSHNHVLQSSISSLFYEWLLRLCRYEKFITSTTESQDSSTETSDAVLAADSSRIDGLLLNWEPGDPSLATITPAKSTQIISDVRVLCTLSGCSIETLCAEMCLMKARLLQHSAVEERHASAASAASAAHATGPSAALFNSAALKFTSVGAAEVITKGVGGAGADEIVQHVRASKGAMIFDTLRRLVLRAQALAHEAASSAGDARITQKAKKVIGAGNFLAKAYNLQLSYLLLAELELDLGAAATESLSDKDNQKIDKHSVDSELLAQFAEVKISSKEHEIEQVLTTGLHKQIIDEEADLCRMLPLISAAAAVASTAASDVMTKAASALVE